LSGRTARSCLARLFLDARTDRVFPCNLGYGDKTALLPRAPRFPFDGRARIV